MLAMVNEWVTYVGERPALARLFLRALTEPTGHPTISRHVGPIVDEMFRFLRSGQEQGVFGPVDPEHFYNAMGGMAMFLVTARPITLPGRADEASAQSVLEKHRTELLGIASRLLGLPTELAASAAESPRQTARVGGSR
jgi:hypothetical protein